MGACTFQQERAPTRLSHLELAAWVGFPSQNLVRHRILKLTPPSNTLAVASDCKHAHLVQSYLDNLSRLGALNIELQTDNTGLGVSTLQMRDEEYIWGAVRRYVQEMSLPEPSEVYF